MKAIIVRSTLLAFLIVFAGCNRQATYPSGTSGVSPAQRNTVTRAIAVLSPTKGNTARGTVTFTTTGDSIRIVADFEGLPPGRHGFHIHEFGDCSAPDAASAGGHFNPGGKPHGGPMAKEHHAGDLGNIDAGQNGRAYLEMTVGDLWFGPQNSIIGHAVVVHASADDLTSQPSGNSGTRLACGVIGTAGTK